MRRRCIPWILLTLLAAAAPAVAEPFRQEVSVGASGFGYYSFLRQSATFLALELAYHRPVQPEGPWNFVRFGGGLRTNPFAADAHVGIEAFAQVQLTARLGIWEAVAGPELGVTGFGKLYERTFLPSDGLRASENQLLSPVFVAFGAAPVRVRLGRFSLSALEVSVGTSLPAAGHVLRVQVNLLSLGSVL